MVFDSAGNRFFVANRAMNRVDIVAASSASILASIDAPAATSVDLSADGSTLWVGTALEQILAIDTHTLQVNQRFPIPGLTPIPGVVFNRPLELVSTSTNKLFVRLRQPAVAQSLLALWDPSTNSFTDLTSSAPSIFQKGLGVMVRSGDSRYLFVAANDASGEAAFFDSFGYVVAGPQVLGSGVISFATLNSDGSKVAALLSSGATQQLLLLDARLNLLHSYSAADATSVLFSRDGQTIYLAEALGNGRVISTLSSTTLQKVGMVPDLSIAGIPSTLEDSDTSEILMRPVQSWRQLSRRVAVCRACQSRANIFSRSGRAARRIHKRRRNYNHTYRHKFYGTPVFVLAPKTPYPPAISPLLKYKSPHRPALPTAR